VHEPLAPGYAPPDLVAWFTQQLKWARGVFDMLLTAYPRFFPKLNLGQRLSYIVRMTYYWAGPFFFLHLIASTWCLYSSNEAIIAGYQDYLFHFIPMAVMTLLIRQLALRRWRHPSLESSFQWKPIILVFATWPIYTLAWIMAVLRVPLRFRPTPKTPSGGLSPLWLAPQLLSVVLISIGLVYTIVLGNGLNYLLVLTVAAGQAVSQLLLFLLLAAKRFTAKPTRLTRQVPVQQNMKNLLGETHQTFYQQS
jgi:cellulose synthase (UDP-forming)